MTTTIAKGELLFTYSALFPPHSWLFVRPQYRITCFFFFFALRRPDTSLYTCFSCIGFFETSRGLAAIQCEPPSFFSPIGVIGPIVLPPRAIGLQVSFAFCVTAPHLPFSDSRDRLIKLFPSRICVPSFVGSYILPIHLYFSLLQCSR